MDIVVSRMAVDDLAPVLEWVTLEDWNVTMADLVAMFNTNPEGEIGAWVNGKLVGCITAVRIGNDIGVIGSFIVDPNHRGQGIGRRLLEHAANYLELTGGRRNSFLSARYNMIDTYKRYGFQTPSWDVELYAGIPKPEDLNFDKATTDLTIKPFREPLMEGILSYDKNLSSTTHRGNLLRNIFLKPKAVTFVAFREGEVVGFGTIQPAHYGYRVAPMYAETVNVARHLIKSLLECVSNASGTRLVVDAISANENMVTLAKELGLERKYGLKRLYTLCELSLSTDKIYGVCNTDTCAF